MYHDVSTSHVTKPIYTYAPTVPRKRLNFRKELMITALRLICFVCAFATFSACKSKSPQSPMPQGFEALRPDMPRSELVQTLATLPAVSGSSWTLGRYRDVVTGTFPSAPTLEQIDAEVSRNKTALLTVKRANGYRSVDLILGPEKVVNAVFYLPDGPASAFPKMLDDGKAKFGSPTESDDNSASWTNCERGFVRYIQNVSGEGLIQVKAPSPSDCKK